MRRQDTSGDLWMWSVKLLGFPVAALRFVGYKPKPLSETEGSDRPLSARGTVAGPPSAAKANVLQGKVLERLDAGRYSCRRPSTSSGEIWAAVFLTEADVGPEVTSGNPMPMDGFQTKTLNHRFDRVVFGTLGLKSQDQGQRLALHNAHDKMSSSASTRRIQVQAAAGSKGRTIAESFAQKTLMKDPDIAVTGKVVKANANIMSGTWTYLRGGSEDPASRTNDLTATTRGSAAAGDTVMVKGTVRADEDLGMGYFF